MPASSLLVSGNVQAVMAFVILLLVAAVIHLYKDNKFQYTARLEDQKQFETKMTAFLESSIKQQELWFEKLQSAGKR